MRAFAMPTGATSPDTDVLVREAQEGDLGAFEALYREHCGRVFAICLRMSGSHPQAEDLVQETFVRAWQKLGSYEIGTSFAAWIARVAVNLALSARRSAARRGARENAVAELVPATGHEGASGSGSLGIDLERAIAALPASARRVFVLHDIEGYRHREIATLLGVATGTSKAQLHRARTALRKALI